MQMQGILNETEAQLADISSKLQETNDKLANAGSLSLLFLFLLVHSPHLMLLSLFVCLSY